MNYPVRDWDKWYLAQGFGNKTSYGFHDGWDINLKTGGNTDLGQDLLAVADGRIVYYHNASHPTSGFGRHMVLECETSRGKRWYHYAHCREITTQVKEVKEGEVVGKLGSTGNSKYAHLHFSVFTVDPKSLDRGIDTIAKTQQQLNDWWEKFEILSSTQESMKKYTEKEMSEMREARDENWDKFQVELKNSKQLESEKKGLKEEVGRLKADVTNYKTEAEQRKKELRGFIEKLAKRLFLPAASDKSDILGSVDRLLEVEDQLKDANKNIAKKEAEFEKKENEWQAEIQKLREMLGKANLRIDALEEEISKTKEEKAENEWFKNLVDNILKLLNRKV